MIDPAIGAAIITSATSIVIAIGVPVIISIAYLIKHIKSSDCLGSKVEFNQSTNNIKELKEFKEYVETNSDNVQNTL